MRAVSAQTGQASPEYVGLIVLLALIASAFAAFDLGPGFAGSVQEAFCRAVGAGCDSGLTVTEPPTEQELLDEALDASLDEFQALKDSTDHDMRMDWTDDGCSAPVIGSEKPWFHFREACERHDFGYRNSKRLGVFDDYKDTIDLIFADDMHDSCEHEAWWERKQCRLTADLFYSAVKNLGGHCYVPGTRQRVPGPCAPERG
jgi:hypothetical protein